MMRPAWLARAICMPSDDRNVEETNVMDRIREMTGIYGLGFRKESVAGVLLPLGIVFFVAVVAVIAFYVL
jgi:hypothetical protein